METRDAGEDGTILLRIVPPGAENLPRSLRIPRLKLLLECQP